MKSFLSYWKPSTADFNLGREGSLNHIASEQYDRLAPGNEVFIVTVRSGVMSLLGKVIVGRIVNQRTAEAFTRESLWGASFHVLSQPGSELPLVEVDASQIAEKLRFVSDRDRLSVVDGRVDAKQLQSMRVLTPQSAALLDATLRCAK